MRAPAKKPKRASPEYTLQVSIVNYLRMVLPRGWLVHHSRNGGRVKSENGRAMALGAKSGWPDLEIVGPGFLGFIEVKDPKNGRLSPEQKDIHKQIDALGYPICVAKSTDDVKAWLLETGVVTREARS